jgi:hypothetical protein
MRVGAWLVSRWMLLPCGSTTGWMSKAVLCRWHASSFTAYELLLLLLLLFLLQLAAAAAAGTATAAAYANPLAAAHWTD